MISMISIPPHMAAATTSCSPSAARFLLPRKPAILRTIIPPPAPAWTTSDPITPDPPGPLPTGTRASLPRTRATAGTAAGPSPRRSSCMRSMATGAGRSRRKPMRSSDHTVLREIAGPNMVMVGRSVHLSMILAMIGGLKCSPMVMAMKSAPGRSLTVKNRATTARAGTMCLKGARSMGEACPASTDMRKGPVMVAKETKTTATEAL